MNKTNFLKSFQKGTGVFETCRLTQNSLKFVKKTHIVSSTYKLCISILFLSRNSDLMKNLLSKFFYIKVFNRKIC